MQTVLLVDHRHRLSPHRVPVRSRPRRSAGGGLTEERGALLRTVVVDEQGEVIGVGRATRRPPAWLADVNLAVRTNREEEAAGWQVLQAAGGVRTWRHPRSGLTCTTLPSTWRPASDPRTDRGDRSLDESTCQRRRRAPGTDPPGHHRAGPDEGATRPTGDLPF